MRKKWLAMTGLVLVVALAGLSGCYAAETSLKGLPSELRLNLGGQQEGIWVNGKGEVTVTPDIAVLRLGVSAQAASVAEAQSQAAEAMAGVKAVLIESGVTEEDIQTQHFSIQQVTKWDRVKEEEMVIGYRVTNIVIVNIREIDKTGAIIDAVAVAGGDLTRIESIGFSVDDPSAYQEEARQKAMADAKGKAEQLAALAGVKLGKPTYISESTYFPPSAPIVAYAEAKAGVMAETPISPGEMEISISVQVVYAIQN